MLIKEQPLLVPPSPKSFGALMELYENNYIQLRLLCGDFQTLEPLQISRKGNLLPLQLMIEESSKHTTSMQLTYIFQEGLHSQETRPDMRIRIYHDARQAEVISHRCRISEDFLKYNQLPVDRMLHCRWRMNRFLYRWIKYLQIQGHKF